MLSMKMVKLRFIEDHQMDNPINRTYISTLLHVDEQHISEHYQLLSGRSHFLYLIEVNQKKYTYRLPHMDHHIFVQPEKERRNLDMIHDLKISSQTLYYDEKTGEKLSTYLEGNVLSGPMTQDVLINVAQTLKKIHQLDTNNIEDPTLIETIHYYESLNAQTSDKYHELKHIWLSLYQHTYIHFPNVFCHNDAQQSNFIINKDKVYLIDWEYAGLNAFYYDIASFGNRNFDDALRLLDAYLERPATKEEQNHVRFYRMTQALIWHLIALKKSNMGWQAIFQIDFGKLAEDFLILAETRYNEIKG